MSRPGARRTGPAERGLGFPVRETEHYATLDMLRGVAAVVVVAHHLPLAGIAPRFVAHGYLAVDFFFELSGFVLAFAYRERLMHSITLGRFVIDRVIRLYPLAVVGVVAGALATALQGTDVFEAGKSDPSELGLVTSFNIFMIPNPFDFPWTRGLLFPANAVIWSLCLEILANVVWAATAYRLRPRQLAVACAIGLTWLVAQVASRGSADIGYAWATSAGGLARVMFGFTLGTLIQLRSRGSQPRPRSAALPVSCLIAVLAFPKFGLPNWFHDIVCIAVAFPLIIVMSISRSKGGAASRLFGQMSYPLYVIHLPILMVAHRAVPDAQGWGPKALLCVATVAACLSASLLLFRFYDEPVRKLLHTIVPREEGRRMGCVRDVP